MTTLDEMVKIYERVAVLESRILTLEQSQIKQTAILEGLQSSLIALHRRFDKQYSFIGGIVFVVTGLWAIGQAAVHFFWKQ